MRFKTFLILLAAALLAITFLGCVERHIKAHKFDIYENTIPSFQGYGPVAVIVPEPTGKEYLVEYAPDPDSKAAGKIYVHLDDMHKNARELIAKELGNHGISTDPASVKQLRFTITKIQWEPWAGGFSVGSYLYFDVETSDGYKVSYKVQDGSGMDVDRAIGGTVSRAVEKLFQDPEVIRFLEGKTGKA